MLNFKLDKSDSYKFRTAPEGKLIQVEVDYRKGSSPHYRGLYLRVSPLEVEKHSDHTITKFGIFSGVSIFVSRLPRKNDKALLALAEQVDPLVPAIVKSFEQDGAAATKEFIKLELAKEGVTQ